MSDPSLDPFLPSFPILPTDTNVTVGLSPSISAQDIYFNQPANDASIGSFGIGRTGQSCSSITFHEFDKFCRGSTTRQPGQLIWSEWKNDHEEKQVNFSQHALRL